MFDSCQTLFLCLPLSKKVVIDIIVNKNPDRFCMIEKVEKTMTENGQSYIRCIAIDKSEKETNQTII